ncbi:hypothetical protein CI102_14576 [Trichoderma harzianum]|nr:hypothetical protein CI102_14576 [Trichoderma harzianum]
MRFKGESITLLVLFHARGNIGLICVRCSSQERMSAMGRRCSGTLLDITVQLQNLVQRQYDTSLRLLIINKLHYVYFHWSMGLADGLVKHTLCSVQSTGIYSVSLVLSRHVW